MTPELARVLACLAPGPLAASRPWRGDACVEAIMPVGDRTADRRAWLLQPLRFSMATRQFRDLRVRVSAQARGLS